jgi:hypothetical protein
MTISMIVVAMGPPSRWTMLVAVVAKGSMCFGTEAYAAATDGIPIAPWPAPRAIRQTINKVGENWVWIIHKNGSVPNSASSTHPEDTARQPNFSVSVPMNGYEQNMPRPMGASIHPACDGAIPQPVMR